MATRLIALPNTGTGAPTLASGATASASGVTMPEVIRRGTPTVPNGDAGGGFNLAAGLDADELDAVYVADAVNARLRKFTDASAGAQVASVAVGGTIYGVAVDRTLQRVYVVRDTGGLVAWYDYGLTGLAGSFAVPVNAVDLLVLPSGNLLVLFDGSPFTMVEYTSAGAVVATWHTGTISNRAVRVRHDGTWVYAGFYSTYGVGNRAVRRFLIADKGVTNGGHMPGSYVPANGSQDLPWEDGGTDKVSDYVTQVLGVLPGGKRVFAFNTFDTGYGLFEADASVPTFERLCVGRTMDASGWPIHYAGYLFKGVVTGTKVWASTYAQHSLHAWDHRTATATWTVTGYASGSTFKGVVVQGYDADKVKVEYRIGAAAFAELAPNKSDAVSVLIDGAPQVRVSMNTWRGFGSGTLAPMNKSAPLLNAWAIVEEPDPAILIHRVTGNLILDTGRDAALRLT